MPAYRKLHTKVIQSFDFNEMPDDFTRCLWLLLPLGLDCEGRGIYNPSWIKAKLMPLREDVTNEQIIAAMEWYIERGMVIVYIVDGRAYFYVPTFKNYQSGTEKEAKSVLPAPPENDFTPELVQSGSRESTEAVGVAATASASVNASVNASDDEKNSQDYGSLARAYEANIGMISPMVSEKLALDLQEFGLQNCVDAIQEAVTNNVRRWTYVQAILKRWKVEGRGKKAAARASPQDDGIPLAVKAGYTSA